MLKIVFDFDHTLAYRDGMWTATLFEILQENGYHYIEMENIRKYVQYGFLWDIYEKSHKELLNGLSWWEFHEKFFERILKSNRVPESEAKRMSMLVRNKYLNPEKWFLFNDTIRVLERLNSAGYECYILSNHTPELEILVNYLGLNRLIKKTFNSALIGYEKPNTQIYQYLINDLKVSPSEIIMVGDNYISDITCARSNGMNAIHVRSPNTFNFGNYSENLDGIISIMQQYE